MKKTLCVIIAVIIALSSMTIIAFADAPNITMTADKTNVKIGDIVTVTVKVAKRSNLAAATLVVTYDEECFLIKEMKKADVSEGTVNPNYEKNKAIYTSVYTEYLETEAVLFTIQFEVKKRGGSISIEANEVVYIDHPDLFGKRENVTDEVNNSLKDDTITIACPHTDKTESENPATCTTEGRKVEFCSECGFVNDTVIPKLPHEGPNITIKEATCKEKGKIAKKCTACGTVYDEKETDVIDHNMQWTVTKPATCTENGEETLKCTMCGHSTDKKEIPADGTHTLKDNIVKDVTCEEDGIKTQSCTKCDYVSEEIVITKTGHNVGEWETVKNPTTKEPGREEKKCTVCGKVIESREIEKLEEYTLGDVNRDGYITAADARLVLRYVAGLSELSATQKAAADTSKDGFVTAADARLILQYVVGAVKF